MTCGAWPEFYILGVQKGATTSLAGALSHAGVNHADKKSGSSCCNRHGWRHCGQETHYFEMGGRSANGYKAMFPVDPEGNFDGECGWTLTRTPFWRPTQP